MKVPEKVEKWEIELAHHAKFWNLGAIEEIVDRKLSEADWPIVQRGLRNLPYATLYRGVRTRNPAFDEIVEKTPWAQFDLDLTQPLGGGRVEDVRKHILGLSDVPGLYIDPSLLAKIRPRNLKALRDQVRPIAQKQLAVQIEQGHTFFLSHEKMTNGPFARHVPAILDARKKEVLELPKEPTLRNIFHTYYGFKMLTEGADPPDEYNRVSMTAIDAFCDYAASIGNKIEPPKDHWVNLSDNWGRTGVPFSRSLMLILLAIQGKSKHRFDNVNTLSLSQDSKALDAFHSRLRHSESKSEKMNYLKAIGNIGLPDSFEVVSEFLSDEALLSTAIHTLARLRHPDAFDTIIQYLDTEKSLVDVLRAAGMTKDSRVVYTMTPYLEHDDILVRRTAIDALVFMGDEGQAVLRGREDPDNEIYYYIEERFWGMQL